MTFFIGYLNNAFIQFLIHYASHMHIAKQIVAIVLNTTIYQFDLS